MLIGFGALIFYIYLFITHDYIEDVRKKFLELNVVQEFVDAFGNDAPDLSVRILVELAGHGGRFSSGVSYHC